VTADIAGHYDDPEGAGVLDDLAGYLGRYVAFPEHGLAAATLWVAHSHAAGVFESTPRLALLSPEPGSGKTRFLEAAELVVANPLHVLNASPASIFRLLAQGPRTLLLDEVDAIFGRHGKSDENEDLRALLNAGHRQGATIPRCTGPRHDVTEFAVFAPVALAGLGDLPETLMSRSVVLRMRRRAPGEHVYPFRRRDAGAEAAPIRERLEAWADQIRDDIEFARPAMPEGVTDRPADVWEALLAVADAAGGHWPATARAACLALTAVVASGDASLGIRLLGDLRDVFYAAGRVNLPTAVILDALHKMDEAPWGDLHGRPMDARGLSRRLGAYGIRSAKVSYEGKSLQGYKHDDLYDTWARYLPEPKAGDDEGDDDPDPGGSPPSPAEAEHAEHPEPGWSEAMFPVPATVPVPDANGTSSSAGTDSEPVTREVPHVPHVPDVREPETAEPVRADYPDGAAFARARAAHVEAKRAAAKNREAGA